MNTLNRICSMIFFYLIIFSLLFAASEKKSVANTINGSEIEKLRKEINEVKRESDRKIKVIEKRINELIDKKAELKNSSTTKKRLEKIGQTEKPYKKPFMLSWEGYADILFSWFDHGPDQTHPGGAESDNRLELDLTRFVIELEGETLGGLGFEAEIEFEHGGTGSALELEFEEFGEFEQETENGGKVILEELYINKRFDDWGKVKAGRFYIAFGLLSSLYKPTKYLATRRPEAETMIIPAVWDEIGLSFDYYLNDNIDLAFQVVNGLDSTGFSSLNWVRGGHQGRFEVIRSDGVAFVGRADYKFLNQGIIVGSSVYYGINTNTNRPKDDLEEINSPLLLLDIHTVLNIGKWHARGLAIWGHLWNADDISERNSRLSNNLNVSRTAVADNSLAIWGELGYNVNSYVGLDNLHRLEPFLRIDYYDTIFKSRKSLFNNPRYERLIVTSGLSYTFMNSVFAKLDYMYRKIGDSTLNDEKTVNLAFGWVY